MLGAPAVALTDHDTMMGIDEFMDFGNKYGINTIPGIEASYVMDVEHHPYLNVFGEHHEGLRRNHLILMAKDMDGYRALIKAVKMSNYHQEKNAVKTITYNVMDK